MKYRFHLKCSNLVTISNSLNNTAAKFLKYAIISIGSDATQAEIDAALNALDNPTTIFGNAVNIYIIRSYDQKGAFSGGNSYIIGYTYADDKHGAQLLFSYSGLKVRYKRIGNWTDLTAI